jgi:hypothetical protein
MVIKGLNVYDNRFGTFTCGNTTVPYAGIVSCSLKYNVTYADIAYGQQLVFTAVASSSTMSFYPFYRTGSSMPVSVPVLRNALLGADIVAENCTQPTPDTGKP